MGHYEDGFWEIYQEVEKKGLREKFNAQIKKCINNLNMIIKSQWNIGNMH